MRVRDSGMPEQAYWELLVDVPLTIQRFEFHQHNDVAEMGCGYGTFTEPVARTIRGRLFAYDIDSSMVDLTKARTANLDVLVSERDVFTHGFDEAVDAVMLFNILHCEEPTRLLQIASKTAPHLLVTHWIAGTTPRGPAADIRPTAELISRWAEDAALKVDRIFDLPPWHFGMILTRSKPNTAE